MRTPMMVLTALALAAPVAGQGHAHGGTEVTGGGQLPAGWHARRDKKAADQELDNVKFIAMGPNGFHATMGQTNAIFWNPANTAQGEFEISATFTQTKANPMHPEGYGLVFNGTRLDAPEQSYVYFLIREGKYLINHRAGEEVHKIVPWTAHDAIKASDASGKAVNTVSVEVVGNDVNYKVNGQVVHQQKRDQIKPDGIVGLRVNMHQDVHIGDFRVKPKI